MGRGTTTRALLPDFTSDGVLPPGDYELTLEEIRSSMLVLGPSKGYPNWDREWRLLLVDGLEILARQLWSVGIEDVFVNGSFVEDKDHPRDIDGYFVCSRQSLQDGSLVRELNLLDPYKVWTWDPASMIVCPGSPKRQLPMWVKYHVELYPHFGQGACGIKDKFGNELDFPAAFRISRRNDLPKGIVKAREVRHDPH
jgi:hypothetical protein